MKIIYIKETEKTCNFVKRIMFKVNRIFNIIKFEENTNNTIYYLPIFKNSKISKNSIKKLSNKANKLLEKDGANTIALSEYLSDIQLLKNYLYSKNINILNGRYLFKCLTYKIIEYIFKIKNSPMEFRRSLITSK